VLLGAGRRLFGILPSRIEPEIAQVIYTPQTTHIRYRVRRCADRRNAATRCSCALRPPRALRRATTWVLT
jgi:hypothetical protein